MFYSAVSYIHLSPTLVLVLGLTSLCLQILDFVLIESTVCLYEPDIVPIESSLRPHSKSQTTKN